MSIVKDRIRPLDPSSLQEFLEPDGGAEDRAHGHTVGAERGSPSATTMALARAVGEHLLRARLSWCVHPHLTGASRAPSRIRS